ncbi:MAG: bifunctional UDP-N-acetylglucosamine diphosphorylase/glucosamine-1-phosphate N-acetyltransferase GlmU [Candidatus Melainabacteria bacterium]|nr:bifunctional UDP-N-acetylglucosamine diphosphorylase/glucosamine-1-phosphate N-acetyltransferase GlmU [Candidatus Melainabacteria bacterium]
MTPTDGLSQAVASSPPEGVAAIVLAAGKGTRLNSDLPKVLHPLMGKPLLQRVLETLCQLSLSQITVVLGHGGSQVSDTLDALSLSTPVHRIVQQPQLGTGHAIQCVKAVWHTPPLTSTPKTVLITAGDVPLIRPETLRTLLATHQQHHNHLTVLTATLTEAGSYGRVLLDGAPEAAALQSPSASRSAHSPQVLRIVEAKDATPEELALQQVNTGIYVLDWETLSPLLDQLSANNAQKEFYLTDLIALAVGAGFRVGSCALDQPDEMLGVNSREDLALCHQVLNQWTLNRLMCQGVTVVDPDQTTICPEAEIGKDSVIEPGCVLQGAITIGEGCLLGPNSVLKGQVTVGRGSRVLASWIEDSAVGDYCSVGPFAHLRGQTVLANHVRIGNFVEVKNSQIAPHTNAAHLSYLGDATIGSHVNVGAGTITANYDAIRQIKHRTVIEDGVKIGSNSVLVAPVTLGANASVAAGSVITKDVLAGSLAIARQRQTTIENWVTDRQQSAAASAALEV